jgi:hypothetical protein
MVFIWPAVYSKPVFGMAVFSVMTLVGIGVVKASENALPGDTLYKAKTALYEPVSEILSQKNVTDEARESIRRRLDEAQVLAVDGRLGIQERSQIEGLIEADLQKIENQGGVGIREEVVLMSKDYDRYFLIVLESSRRIRIQLQSVSTDATENEAVYEDSDSTRDQKEEDEEENEERHSGVKKENSHESEDEDEDEDEDEEEVKQIKKSKSGSSNTGSSHPQEEEEEEDEEEDNSGSGSHSNDEDDEEEEEDEEEEK